MMYQWKDWMRRHPILALIIGIAAGLVLYKVMGPRMHTGLLFR